jgi:AbrB family looped-hinge helix DNA binding protein
VRRRKGYTRLSSKNQVTIPVDVVMQAGLEPGDELRVEAEDGRIVLKPARSLADRRLEAIRLSKGALTEAYEPGYLEKLRDEWR